jgi:hypothetical protein
MRTCAFIHPLHLELETALVNSVYSETHLTDKALSGILLKKINEEII